MSVEVFKFYKDYISAMGYRPPSNIDTFESRNDKKYFYKLYYVLTDEKDENQTRRRTFLKHTFQKHPSDYNPIQILSNFDKLYESFKKSCFENEMEYLNFVYTSFNFIKKFIRQNDLDPEAYFSVGNPPLALKHYKEGSIDEAIIVYGCDMAKLKRKPWFKIYTGELKLKLTKIKTRIESNSNLRSMLTNSFNEIFGYEYNSKLFVK